MKTVALLTFAILIISSISCHKTEVAPTGTYFPQVKKIIDANCITCHYEGGQGMPVILTSDSDIILHAAGIKAATCDTPTWLNKRMPLDGELSEADKVTITAWFENGGTTTN